MIPELTLILLSGIPATRKSTFARYLAWKHDFAHYDLERHPEGWPHPELKRVWDINRKSFVDQLRNLHNRVVLDWGFPVACRSWVEELRQSGVKLFWFDADVSQAREQFIQRDGSMRLPEFDGQVTALQEAGYPSLLRCPILGVLDSQGHFSSFLDIEKEVFAQINE